jgi:phosphoribosyl-AMP cyclohydrolase
MPYLDAVRFDDKGLVTVVVVDAQDGRVLMVAYMNREALRRTVDTAQATYWSRSRQDYWVKGSTSGNVQRVQSIRIDCDGDALVMVVDQTGAACHEGYRSCFFRELASDEWRVTDERLSDPY